MYLPTLSINPYKKENLKLCALCKAAKKAAKKTAAKKKKKKIQTSTRFLLRFEGIDSLPPTYHLLLTYHLILTTYCLPLTAYLLTYIPDQQNSWL